MTTRTSKLTIAMLGAGLAACTTAGPDVRMIERPISDARLPVNERLAEGNAMLRLGNIGLAIEAFRKARRYDPENPDVYVMLASSYDRLGRGDLATLNYEQALALAPHRPDLYVALSGALARQGRHAEARAVLSESERRQALLDAEEYARENDAADELRVHVEAALVESERAARARAVTVRRSAPDTRERGPRLERMARGEVLLRTTNAPAWEQADAAPRTTPAPDVASASPSPAVPAVQELRIDRAALADQPVRLAARAERLEDDAITLEKVAINAPAPPVPLDRERLDDRPLRLATLAPETARPDITVVPVPSIERAPIDRGSLSDRAPELIAEATRIDTAAVLDAPTTVTLPAAFAQVGAEADEQQARIDLERLVETFLLDDMLIDLLADEGLGTRAQLKAFAQASRAGSAPRILPMGAMRGIAALAE
ncbi:tetratricopeptide repeat protein [Sphingomicrobium sp. XHP0235]|uniref:tetratricopeptide repeat protein n=1 Tax=Sphingomicrobium aquimarinum TaxID=3133971 RepID=UPI0031FEF769